MKNPLRMYEYFVSYQSIRLCGASFSK